MVYNLIVIWRVDSFQLRFLHLYRSSLNKNAPIASLASLDNENCLSWNLIFSRNLNERKVTEVICLMGLIKGVMLSPRLCDRRRWLLDGEVFLLSFVF